MLVLPIKRKWYEMILSGEKKEEYREIKPYYTSRFMGNGLLLWDGKPNAWGGMVIFRNGYSKNSPQFEAEVNLRIDKGRQEWGAEPGKTYYVLTIEKIYQIPAALRGGCYGS